MRRLHDQPSERKYEQDTERLAELRRGGMFSVYEEANLAHIAEQKAIAALVARRHELEASTDD